jgi:flagellar biogenesis protein FliO
MTGVTLVLAVVAALALFFAAVAWVLVRLDRDQADPPRRW